MAQYMIIPLGLTDEEEHVYIKFYKKCDYSSMTVKYTVNQIVIDSNKCFSLTPKKVRRILKMFIDIGYIEELRKGSKGNPTIYKVIKIQELNNEEGKGQLKGNQREIKGQLKGNQNIDIERVAEEKGQSKGNQREIKGQSKGNPIYYKDKDKDKDNNIYSLVIDYLNSKVGTNYRSTSKKTKSLIDARINEGFNEEDFKKVVAIKSKEWLGSDMEKFLRPETLFGPKFEGYLNQKGGISNEHNGYSAKNEGESTKLDFSKYS